MRDPRGYKFLENGLHGTSLGAGRPHLFVSDDIGFEALLFLSPAAPKRLLSSFCPTENIKASKISHVRVRIYDSEDREVQNSGRDCFIINRGLLLGLNRLDG